MRMTECIVLYNLKGEQPRTNERHLTPNVDREILRYSHGIGVVSYHRPSCSLPPSPDFAIAWRPTMLKLIMPNIIFRLLHMAYYDEAREIPINVLYSQPAPLPEALYYQYQ